MPQIGPPGLTWRGLETGLRRPLNGHEAGNGGHSQGDTCGAPRQSSTLLLREAVETSASFEARSVPPPFPTLQPHYNVLNVLNVPTWYTQAGYVKRKSDSLGG